VFCYYSGFLNTSKNKVVNKLLGILENANIKATDIYHGNHLMSVSLSL